MPIALERLDHTGVRVPIVGDPFWMGRSLSAGLVVDDPRIAGKHARLRYKRGEWMLSAAEGEVVYVNGEQVPVMPLRSGDELALTSPQERHVVTFRFVNRMDDAFVPPGASWAEGWLNHPGSALPENGPARLGATEPLAGRPRERTARVPRLDRRPPMVLKRLATIQTAAQGDHALELQSRLAGAPHGSLAQVLDGGLHRDANGSYAWMATRFEVGEDARTALGESLPQPLPRVLRALLDLAEGIAHLHQRGVVHRDVSPGNVILRASGGAALVDYGQAFLRHVGARASDGVVGTVGYVAPEEVHQGGAGITSAVDVYGAAAVGYALLTGTPPSSGEDLLEALAGAGTRPPPPSEMGASIPEALESVLLAALDPDPAKRPDAAALASALRFAVAELGLGSR